MQKQRKIRSDAGIPRIASKEEERRVYGEGIRLLRGMAWSDLVEALNMERNMIASMCDDHNAGLPARRPGPARLRQIADLLGIYSEALWEARNRAVELSGTVEDIGVLGGVVSGKDIVEIEELPEVFKMKRPQPITVEPSR